MTSAVYDRNQNRNNITLRLVGSIVATGALAFVGILTETMMNVIFPHLMREFSIDAATVQWVTTAYLLVVAATIPLSAFLKRRFTYKAVFSAACVLAIIGSLLAFWSPSFAVLIVARVVQGVATGTGMPLMFNVILEQSPRTKIGMLMGYGNLVVALAPALGPSFGGIVTTFMPWRESFLIIIALLVLIFILGVVSLRQFVPTEKTSLNPGHVVLIALGFTGLLYGVEQAGLVVQHVFAGTAVGLTPVIAAVSLAVGVVCVLTFYWRQCRSERPLMNLTVLADPSLRWHLVSLVLLQFVMLGISFTVPNFVQMGLGATSMIAGFVILPGALLGAFCAPAGGTLLDRKGARLPVTIGLSFAFLGLLLQGLFAHHLTPLAVACLHVVYVFGYSFTYSNVFTDGLKNVAPQLKADGNAVFNTCQQFGCALGTAVLATVMSVYQHLGMNAGLSEAVSTSNGARTGYFVMAAAIAITALCMARAFGLDALDARGVASGTPADPRN
ncbi:MFS transporter [Bifidobacterium simiarum]|uniref:MFS transporter n=1 Tax=Bifidobacterium simiarum TaxID=2045441 RepID=UPI001BDC4823|nr:MFS transporter [Bifidobacterium simiarum]MBT1166779.1 MFS transporter [Bifidobacterium simiarum]